MDQSLRSNAAGRDCPQVRRGGAIDVVPAPSVERYQDQNRAMFLRARRENADRQQEDDDAEAEMSRLPAGRATPTRQRAPGENARRQGGSGSPSSGRDGRIAGMVVVLHRSDLRESRPAIPTP